MSRMLILDNGAWTLKAGYTWEPKPSVQCPNAVIRSKTTSRIWDAADFHMCRDRSNLFIHSPFQKGYLVDWTIEHPVWQSVFEKLVVDPDETKLVLSDPNMMVPALKQVHIRDEILFEDFEFSAVHKTSGPLCVGYPGIQVGDHVNDTMCTLVVDSGYSFTHVVPIINGEVIFSGVKRMTVGGKHLTNQLLDWITYRQMDMREETFLMNQLKEDVCYVAENFEKDMANMNKPAQKKEMERDFYLPDNRTWFAGRVEGPDDRFRTPDHGYGDLQKITIGVERFAIPEILFSPSDIGINEMGIAETVNLSINSVQEGYRGRLLQNIILVGGNVKFPGFKERLLRDLKPMLPEYLQDVRIYMSPDPVSYSWESMSAVSQVIEPATFVTRQEFYDEGHRICLKKFYNYTDAQARLELPSSSIVASSSHSTLNSQATSVGYWTDETWSTPPGSHHSSPRPSPSNS